MGFELSKVSDESSLGGSRHYKPMLFYSEQYYHVYPLLTRRC